MNWIVLIKMLIAYFIIKSRFVITTIYKHLASFIAI